MDFLDILQTELKFENLIYNILFYNHYTTGLAVQDLQNHEVAVELIKNVSKELNCGVKQYGEVPAIFSKNGIISLPPGYVSILKGIGRHVNNKKEQFIPTTLISNHLPLVKLL